MTKVNIVDTYNTSMGSVIMIKYRDVHVGDEIVDEKGQIYKVKSILMPTSPVENEMIGLLV